MFVYGELVSKLFLTIGLTCLDQIVERCDKTARIIKKQSNEIDVL